jgi:ribosomal protein S18 acetylase RimI-like enzyme
MTIVINRGSDLPEAAVKTLYEDAGWAVYTQDMPGLMQALANSLAVFTAWDGPQLVGLIRIVGDGKTIFYIQDILVLVSHKRRGIGTALLRKALAAYEHVRQKVLLTDDTPETRGFYEANGFRSCDKGDVVAFARFD